MVATCILVLVSSGVALGQNAGSVEAQKKEVIRVLQDEAKARVYTSRVVIGGTVDYFNPRIGPAVRLVDTEIWPGGNASYETFVPFLDTYPSFTVRPEKLTDSLPVGSQVRITKLEWKRDALVVTLDYRPKGFQIGARLKLMYRPGSELPNLQVINVVRDLLSVALIDEAYEQTRRLSAEYTDLKSRLDSTRAAFSSASGAERLRTGENLLATLKGLQRNGAAQARPGPMSDSVDYGKEATEFEPQLERLRAEVRGQRVAAINASLKDSDSQIDAMVAGVASAKVSKLSDWTDQMARIDQARQLLDQEEQLRKELVELGGEPSVPDTTALKLQRVESLTKTLDSRRSALALVELETQYRELERRSVALTDLYTKAFGTETHGQAATQLVQQLVRMRENRLKAQALGSATASAQATDLQRKISRIRR